MSKKALKQTKRNLNTFWVRLWNEHCAWIKDGVTDKTYAITGRLFLNAIRSELEDLGLFDLELADFDVDKSWWK